MVRGMVAVVVVGLLAAGSQADDKKPDAEKIRGEWKVVSAKETRGDDPNADIAEYKDSVWTFGEKELTVVKGKVGTKFAYRLDDSRKPREIDFGTSRAGKNDRRPFEGIYELDGDKLTVCYTVFNVRPTDFGTGRGIAAIKRLVVLERVPPAKGKPGPLAELQGTWVLVAYRADGATLRGADEKSTSRSR